MLLSFVLCSRAPAEGENSVRLAAILEQSLASYESVQDYETIFVKKEKGKDGMGPSERMFMKYEKPWKIYLGWLNTGKKGLQVVYERGRHDNKLAIHQPGIVSLLMPVVFLDQQSPWVREGSESYNIEDAGIGTFLLDFSKAVKASAAQNNLRVEFPESPSQKGQSVEVTFLNSTDDDIFFAYRIRVLFDAKTQLPVFMELYDWDDKLTGTYSYEDLRVNVGSETAEFKRQAHRQLYKIYRHIE